MQTQSVDFEELGDRQKYFEKLNSNNLSVGLPIMARLDGRAFHTFTKSFQKPFDMSLIVALQATMTSFLEPFGASLEYHQSDEITLCWLPEQNSFEKPFMFNGNVQKMCSILAAHASVTFGKAIASVAGDLNPKTAIPLFDCRVWNVPDLKTAAENFMWREMDATKNSSSMMASTMFTVSELSYKGHKARIAMMEEKGAFWNQLAPYKKRGIFAKRMKVLKNLTQEELNKIPEQHRPTGPVERSENKFLELPPLTRIMNLEAALFEGQDPLTIGDSLDETFTNPLADLIQEKVVNALTSKQ